VHKCVERGVVGIVNDGKKDLFPLDDIWLIPQLIELAIKSDSSDSSESSGSDASDFQTTATA